MAKQQSENMHDFTNGSILKKLSFFMLPILGALILQMMYSAVDVLVVGQFGSDVGISAVNTGSSIINMIVFVLSGFAMGVTVLMGRYIGEGKSDRLGRVIGGAILLFAILAVILMVLLLVFARPFAVLMNAPEDALDKTVVYIRICGGGIFFIIGYNLISSIFRGIGNSKLPLIFVGIACVVNIIGDLLFVAVFDMDVAGAALATVMAQAVSLILSLIICKKIDLPFHVRLSDLRFSKEVTRFTLSGIPIAFQELLTQISFLALLAFINGMGTTADIQMASSNGYGIASKLVSIVMLVPSALMQSMSSFISQNVGAGKEKRAQKSMGYGMMIGACIGIFMTAAAYFGGQALASLFSPNVAYQLKAAEYLKGYSLEAIVTSILFSYIGYFNGHNKTGFVLFQGIAQSFIVRLPMAFLMSRIFPDNMIYVGLCAPTATVFGILINTIYFKIYTKKLPLEDM